MRLFAIKDLQTGRIFEETFENKQHAKIRRNELNGKSKRYVVTPGPDHHKTIAKKETQARQEAAKKRKGQR